jgi:hypothetical protein
VRRTVEGEAGPEAVWGVSVVRGGVTRLARGLWFGQVEDFLRRAVCSHVVWDVAQDSASANKGSLRGRPIPPWLSTGLAEMMDLEDRLDLFKATGSAVSEERSYALDALFRHTGEFDEDARRAVFHQQAGTVVDFLVHADRGRGRARLRSAIENLWHKSSFTMSVRWEYRDLFPTLEAMQSAWEAYVLERPTRMLTEERLALDVTDALLEEILAVEIPVIDPKTIELAVLETDFEGLAEHKNREVVQRICGEKAEALLQLTLRSAQEFKPAIESYTRALNAIRAGHTKRFRREFKRARRAHEAVRRLPYFSKDEEGR